MEMDLPMRTDTRTTPDDGRIAREPSGAWVRTAAQKVVIVNGRPGIMNVLDAMLDEGRYEILFVESRANAYSQIKRAQPSLVILCVRLDDMDGFQVLSMLKLDQDTRYIPILTLAADSDEPDASSEAESTRNPVLAARSPRRMN
jgi:CheY-like chemotaxis protein